MSETHAQTAVYVRDKMIAQQEPPLTERGAVKWMRENLFSGTTNILLTLVSILVVYWAVTHLASWFLNSVWNARSLGECREVLSATASSPGKDGACWAVIRERWFQLVFGFYPPAFIWRSLVAFALLFVALAPVLFPDRISRKFLILSAVYPFIMPWLLWGGAIWTPILVMAGFAVGYLVFRVVGSAAGTIAGTIAAIILSILWWLFAVPMISDTLYRVVAESRMETAKAGYQEQSAALAERVAVLQEEQDTLDAEIAGLTAEKATLITQIQAERFRRHLIPVLPEIEETLAAVGETPDYPTVLDAFLEIRNELYHFNTSHGAGELGTAITDLKALVRAELPRAEDPEDMALTEEAQTALSEARAAVEVAKGLIDADAMTDAALDEAVAKFLADMRALTRLTEQSMALGSDIFRLGEDRRRATNLVRNIDRLQANQAALPELRTTAETLRAELPEQVRPLQTVPADPGALDFEITPDEISVLRAAIAAEDAVRTAETDIVSTYTDVGRIGLQPVPSSAFGGFQLSLVIGVVGILASLPLGILLALGRQSSLLIINKASVTFIEVIRGVPLIVWLLTAQFLLNYFLPPGSNFDLVLRVIIMVTLFASAYIAEVVRGGLAALPKGQYEAADALGLDYWKATRLIVLPQALKISIPGIVNTFIGLFKDTTLVLFIGLFDPLGLAGAARASSEWNGIYWELFAFIGLMFFIFCFSMGRYSLYLEKKLQREHR
jgi:general L-amino acid transport system permease protein